MQKYVLILILSIVFFGLGMPAQAYEREQKVDASKSRVYVGNGVVKVQAQPSNIEILALFGGKNKECCRLDCGAYDDVCIAANCRKCSCSCGSKTDFQSIGSFETVD